MTSMQGYDSLVGRGEASGSGGPGAHGERGDFLDHLPYDARSPYDRPAPAVRAAGACPATEPPACPATEPKHRVASRRRSCAAPFGRAAESHRARRSDPARSRRLTRCGYLDRAALKADFTGRDIAPDAAQSLDTEPGLSHRTEGPHPTEDPGHAEDDGESDQYDRTGPRTAPALVAGRAARACSEPLLLMPLLLMPRGAALPCPGGRPPRASHQSPHRADRMC